MMKSDADPEKLSYFLSCRKNIFIKKAFQYQNDYFYHFGRLCFFLIERKLI